MILLRSERKLLARIVFYLPLQYSESCELSLRFLCSGHCLEQFINKIIADSAKQFRLRMRSSLSCAVVYSMTAPPLFQFTVLSGFARLRIKD